MEIIETLLPKYCGRMVIAVMCGRSSNHEHVYVHCVTCLLMDINVLYNRREPNEE